MKLFKKKITPLYELSPLKYPNEYVVRKWTGHYYGSVESFKADSKEEVEARVAFYSQPTVYF